MTSPSKDRQGPSSEPPHSRLCCPDLCSNLTLVIFPNLLLLLAIAAAAGPNLSRATVCRNLIDVTTATLKSASGYRVTLGLHTEDDHGKETHLCQSEYTLRITHPDGTKTLAESFFGNDDVWDRPISVGLPGFTHAGHSALILLAEGGPHPIHELIVYDLEANTWEIADIDGSLKSQLSAACLAGVRVLGTLSTGDVVLAAPDRPGCDPGPRWLISTAGSDTGAPLAEPAKRLPASNPILPLDPGTVR